MKNLFLSLALLLPLTSFALTTGEKAPDFTLQGLNPKSKNVTLSDFKGKIVVLEWLNHGCPFVRKHYDSGNMQSLQRKYTGQNVIWLSIVSSAPGKQGYVTEKEALEEKNKNQSAATDILLDPTGKVGNLYGAKTTPHMYIINKEGVLVYQGAIDSAPDTDKASVASAKNYVASALDEMMLRKKITAHTTKAYGCSVKY
jgi:alkyl hydroperoxide reductase subunit AhpC